MEEIAGRKGSSAMMSEWQRGFSSYQTDLSDAPNKFDNVQSLFAINFNAWGFGVRSIISSHLGLSSSHFISSHLNSIQPSPSKSNVNRSAQSPLHGRKTLRDSCQRKMQIISRRTCRSLSFRFIERQGARARHHSVSSGVRRFEP